MPDLVLGNATIDGAAFRGWLIGHFVPLELGLRSTRDVEIKWQRHACGDSRAEWGVSDSATTLSVLVQGRIRLLFADGREVELRAQGDYALWAPGISHRWRIEEEDTLVLTVRWPSA
jgi:hypothetical protein